MNKRTLSLAALTLLDVPPPEQVRIAARTGFTHVGLRLLPATPTDPDYDMLGDTPAVRATLAALMETGIRVSDVEIVRLTPGFTLDDRLQRFMETAARLGAGQVLVAGNDDNLQRSADNLAILAAAGRPFGLTMNLEPMPWTQLRNIAAAQALIAASGGKTSAFWWTLSISGARENRSPPSPACPRIISTICNSAMARRRGRRASRNLSARPARRATCRGKAVWICMV